MGNHLPRGAVPLLATLLVLLATGCSRGGYEDGAGFSDGFVAGYARDCAIRSPQAEGRWGNAEYSRGYADGLRMGVRACAGEDLGEPGNLTYLTRL